MGDVNGDGRMDVVVSNPDHPSTWQSNGITVHTQLPDGSFARDSIGLRRSTAGDVGALAIGDVDGDNRPDVVAGFTSGAVVVYRGNQSGQVAPGEQLEAWKRTTSIADLEIANLDSDRQSEIVIAGRGFGETGVWVIDATEPSAAEQLPLSGSRKPIAVALGDLDRDSRTDIVVVATGNNDQLGKGYYYANQGQNQFEKTEFETGTAPEHGVRRDYRNHPSFVSLTDIDSDGSVDKIIVGHRYMPNSSNLDSEKISDYIYEIDVKADTAEPELPLVSMQLSDREIVEDGGVSFITLSTPGPARIPINGAGLVTARFRLFGDARLGEDYETSDLNVSLNPGLGRAVVRVEALADSLPEGTEKVIVMLVGISGGIVEGNTAFEISIVEPSSNGIEVNMEHGGQTLTIGLATAGRLTLVPIHSPGPGGWVKPGTRPDLVVQWNGEAATRLASADLASLNTIVIRGSDESDQIDLSAVQRDHFETLDQIQVWAGDGSDTVEGSQLTDKIFGGDGEDTLHGNQGGDLIFGQGSDDEIFGGAGNDDLFGGDGDDQIHGEAGNDLLSGDAGRDTLKGGDGNDQLIGGESVDQLFGQRGRDTLVVDKEDRRYGVIKGGRGKTKIRPQRGAAGQTVARIPISRQFLPSPNVDVLFSARELDQLRFDLDHQLT